LFWLDNALARGQSAHLGYSIIRIFCPLFIGTVIACPAGAIIVMLIVRGDPRFIQHLTQLGRAGHNWANHNIRVSGCFFTWSPVFIELKGSELEKGQDARFLTDQAFEYCRFYEACCFLQRL